MNSENELENELKISRQQISQLKSENEELVRSLYQVSGRLRDSERLKGHFITSITNEIVSPFASILALTENIRRMKEGEMVQVLHMAELILEEAFHLDFQLKNIFVATLIEAGQEEFNFSVIPINELSDHVYQYFLNQMTKNNIRLSVNFTNEIIPNSVISFTSDREKLEMILKNLIANSIKHSPVGSVIDLNFVLEKGMLSIEVSDQGNGVNPDDRRIIFDRFKLFGEKINSIDTALGLGLSIVLAYSEMLGGKVTLNDNYKGGICAMVSIPESIGSDDWEDLEDFLLNSEASD